MNNLQEVHIRLAEKSDADKIHKVLSNTFQEFKHFFTKGAYAVMVVSVQEIENRMEEGPLWIAEVDDKVVGTVGGVLQNEKFYIRGMVVLPQMRGYKIGYKLLCHLESFAQKKNCLLLALTTTAYIDKALRFYKDFGFRIINEPPYEIDGTPCLNMQKAIS